jgi:hypothetical protein
MAGDGGVHTPFPVEGIVFVVCFNFIGASSGGTLDVGITNRTMAMLLASFSLVRALSLEAASRWMNLRLEDVMSSHAWLTCAMLSHA